MRKVIFFFGALLCLGVPAFAGEEAGREGNIIDLTYPFDETAIYWPAAQKFQLVNEHEGTTDQGFYYFANKFSASEHGGTHVDAPRHFFKGGHTVEQIPFKRLIGNGILVDVAAKCLENPDYEIGIEDFKRWEQQFGTIPQDSIILLRTGFGHYWLEPEKYLGTAERGPEAVSKLRFPGLQPSAARWLIEERGIKAVGIDTASIDRGKSVEFGSHLTLCEANVPIFENLANLDFVPPTGFSVVALPMKIKGGSGAPLRVIAIVE